MENFTPRLFFCFRITDSFDMPKYTMVIALILIDLGILFLIIGWLKDGNLATLTARIPTFIGVVLLVISFLAKRMPGRRSLLMHIAVVLAILCIAGGSMGIQALLAGDLSMSTIEQLILLILGLDYTLNSIKSFIHARRQRTEYNG